jgi:hypothetical protein
MPYILSLKRDSRYERSSKINCCLGTGNLNCAAAEGSKKDGASPSTNIYIYEALTRLCRCVASTVLFRLFVLMVHPKPHSLSSYFLWSTIPPSE